MEAVEALEVATHTGADMAPAHHTLGLCLGNLGWMEDAIAEYRKALLLQPGRLDTLVSLSTTYRSIGRRRDALAPLRQAEEFLRAATPKSAAARYARAAAPPLETLAQAYALLGEFEEALRLARQAQTADPAQPGGYLIAAKCCLALKQAEQALPLLRRACALAPDQADAHYTLALALRERPSPDHEEEAQRQLVSAVTLNPRLGPAYFQLGLLSTRHRKWKDAHRAFMTAYQLQFEPVETLRRAGETYQKAGDAARAHYLLGQYAEKIGDLPTALQHFRALSALRAYRVSGSAHAAAVLRGLGKQQEAIATLKEAIALEPRSAELYRQLASAYSLAGRVNEQVAALQKADALDPRNAHSDDLILGLLSFDAGKYDAAERFLERSVEMQPDNGEYHYALAKIYLARAEHGARLAEAIHHLEAARRLRPENVFVYDYLSVAYTKAGRWQEAASALWRAIDLAPQDGRHYFQLGQLYQRHGLQEPARRILGYYQRLRQFDVEKDLLQRRARAHPRDPAAHAALGDLLLTARDYDGAQREFRHVLSLNPNDAATHAKLALIDGELAHPEEQWQHLQKLRRLEREAARS